MNAVQRWAHARIDGSIVYREPRLREWPLLFLRRPGATLRALHIRFMRWAVMPGDTWEDFQLATVYSVVRVTHDHIYAEAYTKRFWDEFGGPAPAQVPRFVVEGSEGYFEDLREHDLGPGPHVMVLRLDRHGERFKRWTPA